MTVTINQKTYYTTAEACKMAGTNRNTLLRWIREGRFSDVRNRDRNGWRLFTADDIRRLKSEVHIIKQINDFSKK